MNPLGRASSGQPLGRQTAFGKQLLPGKGGLASKCPMRRRGEGRPVHSRTQGHLPGPLTLLLTAAASASAYAVNAGF